MQTETQSQSDHKEFSKPGPQAYRGEVIEPEPITYRPDIQAMIDLADKIDPKIKHNKIRWSDLPDERIMEICPRNGGTAGLVKKIDGKAKHIPYYCNICPKCLAANTLKLKERIEGFEAIAENSEKNGAWRKKIVDEGTEAASLKRHIKRNQDGHSFEISCVEAGKTEVWSYIENEPEKDLDKIYGKPDGLDTIDIASLYTRNRATGKRLTTGSGFKKKTVGTKKEDTIRLISPAIIIKNVSQHEKATRIIEETNYIEVAKDADHASRLYIFQFKYILQELEKAGIEIAAIKMNYYNMAKSEILESWNGNVSFWMSMHESSTKDLDPKTDITSHLIFPNSTEANQPVTQ